MSTKFLTFVMVLGIIWSNGDVMPPYFFPNSLRVATNNYIKVLETMVKPWMVGVAGERPYVFQQNSAPVHMACTTQAWLYQQLFCHWPPNLWPPSSPDLNPLDYYVWGILEKVNYCPYNTKQELKDTMWGPWTTWTGWRSRRPAPPSAIALRPSLKRRAAILNNLIMYVVIKLPYELQVNVLMTIVLFEVFLFC